MHEKNPQTSPLMLFHVRYVNISAVQKSLPNAFCIAHRMQNTLEGVLLSVGKTCGSLSEFWPVSERTKFPSQARVAS